MITELVGWTKEVFSPLGGVGLFILAFMESSFFPVPPDILLIVLTLQNPSNYLWLALICTIGSVLGALFGYGIGYVGEMFILKKIFSEEKIQRTHALFHKYDYWAILIAAFTPLPYKVFTIAAGVFRIKIKGFIIASAIGRGVRFFIVALLTAKFGELMVKIFDTYLLYITVIGLFILAVFLIFKRKKIKEKWNKVREYMF